MKKIDTCAKARIFSLSQLVVTLLLLLSQSSCLDEKADNVQAGTASRTLLFYLAGDNGLAGDSELGEQTQEKIDALAAAWTVTGNNHLLVYQDRGGEHLPRLLNITTGTDGKGEAVLVEEYPAEDSASPRTFTRVLNDMTRLYPGTDYGLMVFSQTSGWLPEGTHAQPRSVITDGHNLLELIGFARAIPSGQFRFILFESGLMASLEVAYELRDKADYILASSAEIPSPGFAPLYGKMLQRLYQGEPELTGFASDYYAYRNTLSQPSERAATISVIRTAELAPLKKLLSRAESHVEHWEWVDRTDIQHFDRRPKDYLCYDLRGYIRSIGTQQEIDELAGILDKAIAYQATTEAFMPADTPYGYPIKEHCGLTLYIPIAKYPFLNTYRERLLLFSPYQ